MMKESKLRVVTADEMVVNKTYKTSEVEAVKMSNILGAEFVRCGSFKKWTPSGIKNGKYMYSNVFSRNGQPVIFVFCKLLGATIGAAGLVPVKEVDIDKVAADRYGYIADYLV